MFNEVEARTKKFFEDPTLPKTAVFAVRFERVAGGTVFEHYANLYFWKKLRPKVLPLLKPLGNLKIRLKTWTISLVKTNQYAPLTVTSFKGLSQAEVEQIKKMVAEQIGEHLDKMVGRGKPRTLPRDEAGKAIKPPRPKAPAKPKKDNEPAVKIKKPKPAKPVSVRRVEPTKTQEPEIDDLHIDELDGPAAPVDALEKFKNAGAVESYILKMYERPAHALSDSAWAILWSTTRNRLPQDFIDKYKDKLDRASQNANSIGVFASIKHLFNRHLVFHASI